MIITVRKEQLVEAMRAYNADVVANPEGYSAIDNSGDCAENQVEQLLSYLPNKVYKKKPINDCELREQLDIAIAYFKSNSRAPKNINRDFNVLTEFEVISALEMVKNGIFVDYLTAEQQIINELENQ